MSFNELITEVAKTTGLPRPTVRLVLTVFQSEAKKVLKTGERVVLPGFGTFFVRDVRPRALFGGTRKSEGKRSIRFRESRRS